MPYKQIQLILLFLLSMVSCVSPEGKAYREKVERWNRPMEVIDTCEAIRAESFHIDSNLSDYKIDSAFLQRRNYADRSKYYKELKKVTAYKKGEQFVKFEEINLSGQELNMSTYYLNPNGLFFQRNNLRHYKDSVTFDNYRDLTQDRKEIVTEFYLKNGEGYDEFDFRHNHGYQGHTESFLKQQSKLLKTITEENIEYFQKK